MVDQKAKSLVDLLKLEKPQVKVVLRVFKEYAMGGWSVCPKSIYNILDKTPMNMNQLNQAAKYMFKGFEIQRKKNCTNALLEYAQAYAYVRDVIDLKKSTK